MASIQLKDLVPGKNYKVKVRAKYKGEDPGPWSKILNFKAPIKSKDDDDDTLNSKYGIVVGSKKDPKRGYIISSTFNGQITLKNGLVIDDDKNNTNIGTQGWAIDHKGNSIFNNIVARGQLIIDLNNNQGRMYFGENIPAFGTNKADGIKLDAYNYWFRTKSVGDKRPSWRVGDEDSFLSYDPDSNSANGKLIVKGQIQAGLTGANQVLLGANVGGAGIAGIKIDESNFWYDADTVANNAIVFKVSGEDATGITVNKAGRVTINTDHSGGRMTGPLTIRLTQGQAADKFLIGQDVRGSGQDGIVLNSNNYWTLQDGAGASKAAYFKVGGATKYILWDGTDLTVSAQIQAGVGTNNTVLIGPDVGGTGIGGIKLDNNNFWYDPTKVTGTNIFFQVKSDNQQTSISVAKGGNVLINGEQTGGSVTGTLDVTTGKVSIPYATGKNILIGKNVSGSNDGINIDANNYWYVNNSTGSVFQFKAGGASRYIKFDGSQLTISTDTILIGGVNAATQAYADSAAAGAAASINVLQTLNGQVTGVTISSLGQIFSAGKTYNSSTPGWILEYNSGTPRFEIGSTSSNYLRWTGSALEVNGKVLAGSTIGSSNIVVNDPAIVSSGNILNSITFKGTSLNNPTAISITPDVGGGQILFARGAGVDGAVFSTYGSKYADSAYGSGIAIGSPSGYPFIEVGSDISGSPKISLYTKSSKGIEIRENNFIFWGGDASRIRGIGTVDAVPANKKILYGGDSTPGSTNDNLVWGPVPTGGGGAANISLEYSLSQNLLGYNQSTGALSLDTQGANLVFAGPKSGTATADPSFRKLVAADLPIAAGTGISLSTDVDDKMRITSTSSAGYSNGTNVGNINKITYSGSAPQGGRTNGDIHFVL